MQFPPKFFLVEHAYKQEFHTKNSTWLKFSVIFRLISNFHESDKITIDLSVYWYD